MEIRRLLKFVTCIRKRKYRQKQDSFLLRMPGEIINEIVDLLQLPARILLSQACRGLWYLLHSECSVALQEATSAERLDYLAALAYYLPNYQLCGYCNALHIVDPRDFPAAGPNKYSTSCPALNPWSHGLIDSSYHLMFHHVQLAVKYTRLRNIHQNYRTDILQRYTSFIPHFRHLLAMLDLTAEPVVVQDKFILKMTHVLHNFVEPLSVETLERMSIRLCPHLRTDRLRNGPSPLLAAVLRTFQAAGSSGDVHSCDLCPTDYMVELQQDQVTFHVWMDLGSGISPTDPYWRSHVWWSKDVARAQFIYEHGSIRELYYAHSTTLQRSPTTTQAHRRRDRYRALRNAKQTHNSLGASVA